MASVSRLSFSLLVLLTVNGVYSAVDAGRSSSGTGPAYQTCPTGYYCPFDKLCHYPRSNRCTGNQNCSYLDECYQESDGSYLIRIGHAKLFGSKRTLFEHRFVIYRGFAYEFGGSYNMHQIQITSMLMEDILIVMESQMVELVIAALPMLVSS